MEIEVLSAPLLWADVHAVPMQELCHDWQGEALAPPARFAVVEDPSHLWLIAGRQSAAKPHPAGDCGDFQAELWRYDVAELFIADATQSSYLEFNLSPTGAWWMERFSAPRQAHPLERLPAVLTHAGPDGVSGWRAALGLPLDWLRATIGWSEASPLNVTLILETPEQRFVTATDLGGGEPDFHRPQEFVTAPRRPPAPR